MPTVDRQYFAHMMGTHYVIEGQQFPSVKSIHLACVERGFIGSVQVVHDRLKAGDCTWAALSAPKDTRMDAANAGRAKRQQGSREEMARLCADLDARKANLRRP